MHSSMIDYIDRSRDKPWKNERPRMRWSADDNAERAYMLGVYANGCHFAVYDYRRSGSATLTEWDGMSHAIYLIGSFTHFITKELSYLRYQVE